MERTLTHGPHALQRENEQNKRKGGPEGPSGIDTRHAMVYTTFQAKSLSNTRKLAVLPAFIDLFSDSTRRSLVVQKTTEPGEGF